MRVRAVRSIHVAAYLFSVYILGCSAFSYYRYVALDWLTVVASTHFRSAGGKLYFAHNQNDSLLPAGKSPHEGFTFRIDVPGPIGIPHAENYLEDSDFDEVHFLGLAYGTVKVNFFGVMEYTQRYCILPYWWLLIFPTMWMCGFYLLKLRLCATRAETRI